MPHAPFQSFDDLDHDEQFRQMVKDAQLLQCFAVRSATAMPDTFHAEFAAAASALTARLDAGPPPPPADDQLATQESRFLHLYDRLATALAPVSAQSVRHTIRANRRRLFFPTLLATLAAVLVFAAVIVCQGYWVLGKRYLDLAQRQDAKRQELVMKAALIADALDRNSRRRAELPGDCKVPPPALARLAKGPPVAVDPERARQCAVVDTLKEEQFRLELEQRPPLDRDQKELADQFAPVLSMVRYLYEKGIWQREASDWERPFDDEIAVIKSTVNKDLEKLRPPPSAEMVGLRLPAANGPAPTNISQDFVRHQFERQISARAAGRVAEVEQRRSRVLMHRVDVVLDILKNYLVPALMGLLGALIFVLRDIGTRLRSYAYVPDSLARGVGRIVVGTIAGVFAGWLVPDTESVAKSIPPLVIPFVFGYSVEILFGLLDKAAAMFSGSTPTPRTTT